MPQTQQPELKIWSDKRFLGGLFFLFLALTLWRMISFADHTGYFMDESALDTSSAAKFFRSLDYSGLIYDRPFDPRISTGLAATWITGISWNLGFSLFVERILLILIECGNFLLLASIFFRRYGIEKWLSFVLASFTWMFFLRQSPYSLGFIQNLGELPAALYILWGLVFLPKRPLLAFLCFGVGVWLAKVMLIGVAFAFASSYWLSTAQPNVRELKRTAGLLFAFFLPLLFWMLLIYLRWGGAELQTWIQDFAGFVWHGSQVRPGSIQAVHPGMDHSLWGRLTNPNLEWLAYTRAIKGKILLLMLGPALLAPLLFRKCNRAEKFYVVVIPIATLVYAFWWFFLDSGIFLRHGQPAFFLGFGYFVFFLLKFGMGFYAKAPKLVARLGLVVFAVVAIWEVANLKKEALPVFEEGTSYARACKGEMHTPICMPHGY